MNIILFQVITVLNYKFTSMILLVKNNFFSSCFRNDFRYTQKHQKSLYFIMWKIAKVTKLNVVNKVDVKVET